MLRLIQRILCEKEVSPQRSLLLQLAAVKGLKQAFIDPIYNNGVENLEKLRFSDLPSRNTSRGAGGDGCPITYFYLETLRSPKY